MLHDPTPTSAIAEDWRHHSYYSEAERWVDGFWGTSCVFLPFFEQLDIRCLLELACGQGRHAAQIRHRTEQMTLVDVNQENIEFCRRRFSSHSNMTYLVNNGSDLGGVLSASQTAAFCYDAMVHFEADAVIAYLWELARVLQTNGRAVLHYSNMHWMPGSTYGEGPHMRNFFSEGMMLHFTQRAGFRILRHQTMDWGGNPVWRNLDGLVLLEKI